MSEQQSANQPAAESEKAVLNAFAARFIGTIGPVGPDSDYDETGGTLNGWDLDKAFELFDKDWPSHKYADYMAKLKCRTIVELVQKLHGRVSLFPDPDNSGHLRVAVIKSRDNGQIVDFIDASIERKLFGTGNYIPVKNEHLYRALRKGKLTFDQVNAILRQQSSKGQSSPTKSSSIWENATLANEDREYNPHTYSFQWYTSEMTQLTAAMANLSLHDRLVEHDSEEEEDSFEEFDSALASSSVSPTSSSGIGSEGSEQINHPLFLDQEEELVPPLWIYREFDNIQAKMLKNLEFSPFKPPKWVPVPLSKEALPKEVEGFGGSPAIVIRYLDSEAIGFLHTLSPILYNLELCIQTTQQGINHCQADILTQFFAMLQQGQRCLAVRLQSECLDIHSFPRFTGLQPLFADFICQVPQLFFESLMDEHALPFLTDWLHSTVSSTEQQHQLKSLFLCWSLRGDIAKQFLDAIRKRFFEGNERVIFKIRFPVKQGLGCVLKPFTADNRLTGERLKFAIDDNNAWIHRGPINTDWHQLWEQSELDALKPQILLNLD